MQNWTEEQIPDQHGRRAVVTGANSGVGRVTALELARHGAAVVLAVRNVAAGEEAAGAIRRAVPGAEVEVRKVDLASLASIHAFAADLPGDVDLLVNNAGVALTGKRPPLTVDGFDQQMGTNALGPYALTGLLLDRLAVGKEPRVVTLSSIVHRWRNLDLDDLMSVRSYQGSRAYAISKLVGTILGLELDRRLRASGSPVISVLAHPGMTRTNLTPRAMADQNRFMRALSRLTSLSVSRVEAGARPQLYAATATGVRGGQFFGPRGVLEVRGPVTEVRASAPARDPGNGRRMWAQAARLTGVAYL
ncbi:SDR family NAD(P)-dependent oxidoreductase [Micromonospora zingiberis]|uniref:SDR family NAD(P)-dependent oxidoreductase n=1 Tax=Micromonospora zingiberis TaxID=2053011 RepID=A0A4R0GIH1_9ACTN|nr:oxidoreductase [Micromonospora zingiberis]TCB96547.1 SDR family NAD(P)-dependent oxidoreductase [Micromonospora zingiberis]